MEDKQLLAALQQHPVLDLYQLFQEVGQNSSLYALLMDYLNWRVNMEESQVPAHKIGFVA